MGLLLGNPELRVTRDYARETRSDLPGRPAHGVDGIGLDRPGPVR